MKIADIVPGTTDIDNIITGLKRRSGKAADMVAVNKALNPDLHDINDIVLYPDKKIYKLDNSGTPITAPYNVGPQTGQPTKGLPGIGNQQAPATNGKPIFDRMEKMNRVALALQKLIIKRAVSFSVGNPIIRTFSGNLDEDYNLAIKGLQRVMGDNFEVSLNKKIAKALYSTTEVAEYWYCSTLAKEHELYGFKTAKQIECAIYSPLEGQKLYPKRNLQGKLICLSREFELNDGPETVKYFEAITDEEYVLYNQSSQTSGWAINTRVDLPYGILPANYVNQDEPDFADVNWIVDRLEYLLSKWGEVNNYNMGPTRFVEGKISSWGQKGEAGTVVQGEPGSKMQILGWDHAPQSVKDEIESLLKFIFTLTQTPDISFDNLKSIGTISGVALKLLFTDAHLKVADKADLLLPFFKNRDKICLAILSTLNKTKQAAYDKPDVVHALDPFMVADEKEQAEITLALNGNQPVRSQETTVKEWGGDKAELDRIRAEEKSRTLTLITEPTE